MRTFAIYELIVCACLFAAGFLVAEARRPPARAVVRAPGAMLGLLLQVIGFTIALALQRPPSGPAAAVVAAALLAPLSVACAWWSFAHLGKQLRIRAELVENHQLVTTGPYALVRHPIYAALLAIYLAAGLLLSRWPAFVIGLVFVLAGTQIRVRFEERLLRSRFSQQFDSYRRRVPAYLPSLLRAR